MYFFGHDDTVTTPLNIQESDFFINVFVCILRRKSLKKVLTFFWLLYFLLKKEYTFLLNIYAIFLINTTITCCLFYS